MSETTEPGGLWGHVFSRWGYPLHITQTDSCVRLYWDDGVGFDAELMVKRYPGADWWTVTASCSRTVVGESVHTQSQAAALAPRLALLAEMVRAKAEVEAKAICTPERDDPDDDDIPSDVLEEMDDDESDYNVWNEDDVPDCHFDGGW